jgi:hypothetical protein
MTMPAVYFSHGQESGPWGSKIKSMAATTTREWQTHPIVLAS